MLFLGFSAGVPILLIFSTLGLWLNEAGVVGFLWVPHAEGEGCAQYGFGHGEAR